MSRRDALAPNEGRPSSRWRSCCPLWSWCRSASSRCRTRILHQHVISRITREGANLISRDVALLDATNALKTMSTAPVDFTDGSQLVLSVLKKGCTGRARANYDKIVLYQRYCGRHARHRQHPDHGRRGRVRRRARLQGHQLRHRRQPADHQSAGQRGHHPGGLLYVAEVFTQHAPLTPLDRFGVTVPPTLQSIAYF